MNNQPMQAPMMPVTSQPPVTPTPVMPPEPNKSKKGMMIWLITGGVALIAVIVTIILVITLSGGITPKDYLAAQEKAQEIVNSVEDVTDTNASITTTTTQSDIDEMVESLEGLKKSMMSDIKSLGNEKAVKEDETAADMYKSLKASAEKYNESVGVVAEVYEQFGPVLIEMFDLGNEFSTITSQDQIKAYSERLRDLADKMADIDVSNSEISGYASNMSEAMVDMADLLDKILAGDSSAVSDLTDAAEGLQTAADDIDTELKALSENAKDFANDLNELGKYLTKKANGKE
ncbi:MAG: hypothetical protein LBM09_02290 [Candidatus Nomurabacteria bacterium]|jgi:cob(I)alamin adenosyltransferase|nr:hypothetical protein [Candidatus Nomurabacteria bacterium]